MFICNAFNGRQLHILLVFIIWFRSISVSFSDTKKGLFFQHVPK